MTTTKPSAQVKYELLEENKRTGIKLSRNLRAAAVLLSITIVSSVTAFYYTWMQEFSSTSSKNNEIDLFIFGSKTQPKGLAWASYQRGNLYGEAIVEMSDDDSWSELQLDRETPGHEPPAYKLICYYGLNNNALYPILTPDMIDANLCTHINIAFATVNNGTIQPRDPSDVKSYEAILALKKDNPSLKVMMSVEWFTSEGEFAWAVSNVDNRTRFVDEAVRFLEKYELDGLDIDWEFPSWPTEVPNQTNCFMDLLELLSSAFHNRKVPLLLSIAAGAPKPIIDRSYNITSMPQYIDFVNIMAYDYHMYQSYLPLTGANAPLYQRQAELGYFTTLNLNWTVSYWLYKGMPAEKIIVGMPTYGHSFTLINGDNHGWEAPSSGFGVLGSAGFVTYYEVCQFIGEGASPVFDYESKVPYAFKDTEWISFDNEQSIAYKAEFVKELKLGGAMIYSLNNDDIKANCDGKTRFPLTKRVKTVLEDDEL